MLESSVYIHPNSHTVRRRQVSIVTCKSANPPCLTPSTTDLPTTDTQTDRCAKAMPKDTYTHLCDSEILVVTALQHLLSCARFLTCMMTQRSPVQEATREAEGADLKLQVSAHQQHIVQLLSAVSGKDATIAEARQKLGDLTQQLASHEHQSEQAAAAKEAVIAEMSHHLQSAGSAQADLAKQLQETVADRETAVSVLTKQLQEAEADREAAVVGLTKQLQQAEADRETAVSEATKHEESESLEQQLASSKAEHSSSLATKDAELADLTQQLQASQRNLRELAERAAGMERQLTERSGELTKHQALVKQLQAAESASQARLLALTELSSEQVSALCH